MKIATTLHRLRTCDSLKKTVLLATIHLEVSLLQLVHSLDVVYHCICAECDLAVLDIWI